MKQRPSERRFTGWLAPRWPYFSFAVRAPWLGELISQCRAAAAGEAFPLVRYVLDVFVSAGTPEGGG